VNPDLIGEVLIKIDTMCIGSGLDEWYKLHYKGKPAG
jgi:hypothetical protein